MSDELGGFQFDFPSKRRTVEPVGEELSWAEARRFEISPEGSIKIYGYSPAEIKELLSVYREHMSEFAREMQLAQAGMDAVTYRPEGS